jgi:endoglucanase
MRPILITICVLANIAFFTGCAGNKSSASDVSSYTFKRGVNISHWLSQNYGERTYAAPWFTQADVAWIADQGFDHIRVPIDSKHWMTSEGALIESAIEPFDRACEWAQAHNLGVILDVHYLPGASFSTVENELFTNEALIVVAENFWAQLAERYADAGSWLRFELINEPVAERNAQLNPLLARLLAAVRATNPTRVVYFTSNKWGQFNTVTDLELPDDPNVALTVHFYKPFPFTHQRAAWTDFKPPMPQVDFPGIVPDITNLVPKGHPWALLSGTTINTEISVDPEFEKLAKWAKENAPDLEIHIGEFGVYEAASPQSIQNYVGAVVAASERHGFGWAIWDYCGGFAIRDSKGQPTAAMRGIIEQVRATRPDTLN